MDCYVAVLLQSCKWVIVGRDPSLINVLFSHAAQKRKKEEK